MAYAKTSIGALLALQDQLADEGHDIEFGPGPVGLFWSRETGRLRIHPSRGLEDSPWYFRVSIGDGEPSYAMPLHAVGGYLDKRVRSVRQVWMRDKKVYPLYTQLVKLVSEKVYEEHEQR
jgi:hypothetical protein